jgi:hypothetical protein
VTVFDAVPMPVVFIVVLLIVAAAAFIYWRTQYN